MPTNWMPLMCARLLGLLKGRVTPPLQRLAIGHIEVPYLDYQIPQGMRVMPWMSSTPSSKWRPDISPEIRIGARLPYDWDQDYREKFRQEFQPIRYMMNQIALSNYIRRNKADAALRDPAIELAHELVEYAEGFVTRVEDRAYLVSRFDFVQEGVFLPLGWVSGIANAFMILGNMKIGEVLPDLVRDRTLALAEAYRFALVEGEPAPEHWISFIDDENHLWFEEYPMPDGRPNLVLNGHIYAVHALLEVHNWFPDQGFDLLAKAGITTVRANIHRFRRKGKSNIYSLRGTRKGDYMPARTVRQQCELFALTGDEFFRNMASAFYNDTKDMIDYSKVPSFRHCEDRFLWNEHLRE